MSSNNYKFNLIGDEQAPFAGYTSTPEKTRILPTYMIRGSYNTYVKRSGNIANRPGLKLWGSADATEAGITSDFEYKTSSGQRRLLRVIDETAEGAGDAKLQVELDQNWYDMKVYSTLVNPALTKTKMSFTTWFDGNIDSATRAFPEFKNRCVFVRGNEKEILHWSGGIAKVGSVTTVSNSVTGFIVVSGGTGYAAGDELTLGGGTSSAKIRVTLVSSGEITSGYFLSDRGAGYATGTYSATGGSGTGATFQVTSVGTSYNLVKQDTSSTWKDAGFANTPDFLANSNVGYLKAFKDGTSTEFTYVGGADGTSLIGITTDVSGFADGDVIIQSTFVETSDELTEGFKCDMIESVNNQVCVGSYTSNMIHIGTLDTTTSGGVTSLGFLNFLALSNDLVVGDPDFVIMDDVANGMIARKGRLYVSSGDADWYEIELNYTPPVTIPLYHGIATGAEAYVITKVEKKSGSGRSGLKAQEFIDLSGDNIIYLGKDNQVRMIGTFSNIEGTQFPVISNEVYEELQEEDFDDGHLKIIEDFVYISAPQTGRHWMLQLRTDVALDGSLSPKRTWHPPQISGISRFLEIDGVTHGHSNSHPETFQIWDTGQWHDDIAGEEVGYNCVAKFAYRNHGRRFIFSNFDKVAVEGFLEYGTPLYGNIYYEYQGSEDVESLEINTEDTPSRLFAGSGFTSIGGNPLGSNPLGSGPIEESNNQELLPKFKTIIGVKSRNCTEYSLEVLSNAADARWELVCLGTNAEESGTAPTYLQ